MIVYKITFPNNKVYIGITTKTLEQRMKAHKQKANKKGIKSKVQCAIKSYGLDNCIIEVLETHTCMEDLYKAEIANIKKFDSFNNGYNSTLGGEGTPGKPLSEKNKLEHKKRREGMTEAEKEAYSKSLSEGVKKVWENPEYRKRMSKITQDRWNDPEFRKLRKSIDVGNGNGIKICDQFGNVYNSCCQAANMLGLPQANINAVVRGKRNHCGGYIFKKVESKE